MDLLKPGADRGLDPDRDRNRMRILTVSGFLGAGKTTFIKALVGHLSGRVCVLENEFGDSSVDRTVLQGGGELDVWELTEGCICCSSREGLIASVLSIAGSVKPDNLVIESTGVGLLSEIMAVLRQLPDHLFDIVSPVCIVDALHVEANIGAYETTVLDQIQAAGTIVLSKGEALAETDRAALATVLRTFNPHAEIHRAYTDLPPGAWRALLGRPAGTGRFVASGHDDAWETVSLKGVSLPSQSALLRFLEGVVAGQFGNVARAKGIVACGGEWLHFELAGLRYEVSGHGSQPEGNVVLIGRELDRSAIEDVVRPA